MEAQDVNPYSMTTEILEENLENENYGRFYTQMYAGFVASISSISFGAVLGWSSPTVREILDDSEGHITTTVQLTLLASLGPLGCAFGIIVWSYFNIKLGPRKSMLIQSPLLFLTWLTLALVSNAEIALAGRFFCGFFAVANRICSETLLLDSVHKKYLPHMVIPYKSFVSLGVLIAYMLGYNISDVNFSLCNCFIVFMHFIILLICPESPIFLYDVNIKKAEAALRWYRGRDNIYTEMRSIKKHSDLRKLESGSYKYMLFSKVVMKAIIIVLVLNVAQVFSGYYIYLYYNMAVVRKYSDQHVTDLAGTKVTYKSDAIGRNIDSMILGFTMFTCSLLSTWLHFRNLIGIKKPLLISCFFVYVNLILIGVYFYLRQKQKENESMNLPHYNVKQIRWIYLILVNTLVIFHETGLSICPDIMLLEYVPREVYPRAKIIVKFCQWMCIFLIVKTYFGVQYYVTGWGLMGFQAVLLLIVFILIFFYVVESKNKTLLQIQTAMGGNPVGTRSITARREEAKTLILAS